MHSSKDICFIVWREKRPVLLISTSTVPVQLLYIHPRYIVTVLLRNGVVRDNIQTFLVHLEYTTHMRGIDVADQLQASYSCQSRSHKWWHHVFHFVINQTVVNMYIIYLEHCASERFRRMPMTHLQFKTVLCEALLQNWQGQTRNLVCYRKEELAMHLPRQSRRLNRPCILCGNLSNFLCLDCNRQFLCLNAGCFVAYHCGEHQVSNQRRWNYNV
jgi:hypothetical protein